MEQTKKTADIKAYMKTYRATSNQMCEVCGGKYNKYTEEKHNSSKKHQAGFRPPKTGGKGVKAPFDIELNKEEISKWLAERFLTTGKDSGSEYNKTPRVDKTSSIWKKLSATAESLKYQYLLKNRLDIVKKAYATPSSQQSALSALKIVLDHVHPLGDLKQTFFEEGKALSAKYIEEVKIPDTAMTYEQLKKYETDDNPIIALFAHLYNPDMPALRLGDFVNATVGKDKNMNAIILSRGVMVRHISKNMPTDKAEIINLSPSLIKYIKKLKIKGALFGDLSLQQVVNMVGKTLGEGNGSRHWRRLYVTEVVSKMSGKEKVSVAKEMNHSVGTAVLVYDRQTPKKKSK